MRRKLKIGIIGFGNMGSSFGFTLARNRSFKVFIYDKDRKKTKKLKVFSCCRSPGELINKIEVLILAIKPQDVESFLVSAKSYLLKKKPLLISIAAGISLKLFQRHLKNLALIRIMPNLAVKVGESVSFISRGKSTSKKDLETARKILSCTGEVFVVGESYLDKVTAISGSGPGYIFYFMSSIYNAALKLGFNKSDAKKMVIQTFWGAVKLAKQSNQDFRVLIKQVASKRGITEAALAVFKKEGLDKIIAKAVSSAYGRARKISSDLAKTKRN